jgi:hypothetical protein
VIVEVDLSGKIVWQWSFLDHAIQDIDSAKANYVGAGKTIANYPGKINLNLPRLRNIHVPRVLHHAIMPVFLTVR